MIDLDRKSIDLIMEIFSRRLPGCEIRIFGSRITGKTKKYSDIDLAVVGKEKLDPKLVADVKEEFSNSNLPYIVDILDWNAISDEFRKALERNGFKILNK